MIFGEHNIYAVSLNEHNFNFTLISYCIYTYIKVKLIVAKRKYGLCMKSFFRITEESLENSIFYQICGLMVKECCTFAYR